MEGLQFCYQLVESFITIIMHHTDATTYCAKVGHLGYGCQDCS